jgi:hypothetical protein
LNPRNELSTVVSSHGIPSHTNETSVKSPVCETESFGTMIELSNVNVPVDERPASGPSVTATLN